MNVSISSEGLWLRVVVTDENPWQRDTFFVQVDATIEAIRKAYENSHARILIDLSMAMRIDSSIITVLIQTIRMARDQRIPMLVAHDSVLDVITFLGMDKIADVVHPDDFNPLS